MFLMTGVILLGTMTNLFAYEDMHLVSSMDKSPYDQSDRFEFGPFIGYHFFDDDQNLENSLSYGARFGYNFSKRLGAEFVFGFSDADVDNRSLVSVTKGQYGTPIGSTDLKYYQLNAIYQFSPGKRLSPFVTAGLGKSHYSPNAGDNDSNTINLGVGVKYWVKRDIAVRADVTAFEEEEFRNYSATVALVYSFGDGVDREEEKYEPEPVEVIVVADESPMIEEKVKYVAARPGIVILAFEDIHFDFDKATLTDAAKVILKRSIWILKDNPGVKVRIAGYTSASGSSAYNQRLSERRAAAVENYLINEGLISPDRLRTIGFGERRPAAYEASPKRLYSNAAMSNMRVLFETELN
jgi:OOP family OmpA-OmpF porin